MNNEYLFKREDLMYPIIGKYLKNNGYRIYYNLSIGNFHPRIFDVVGINQLNVVVVEAKLNKYKKTMQQAITRLYYSDNVYIAFPNKYADYVYNKYDDSIEELGIGLLSIGEDVEEIIIPEKSEYLKDARKQKLLEKIKYIDLEDVIRWHD